MENRQRLCISPINLDGSETVTKNDIKVRRIHKNVLQRKKLSKFGKAITCKASDNASKKSLEEVKIEFIVNLTKIIKPKTSLGLRKNKTKYTPKINNGAYKNNDKKEWKRPKYQLKISQLSGGISSSDILNYLREGKLSGYNSRFRIITKSIDKGDNYNAKFVFIPFKTIEQLNEAYTYFQNKKYAKSNRVFFIEKKINEDKKDKEDIELKMTQEAKIYFQQFDVDKLGLHLLMKLLENHYNINKLLKYGITGRKIFKLYKYIQENKEYEYDFDEDDEYSCEINDYWKKIPTITIMINVLNKLENFNWQTDIFYVYAVEFNFPKIFLT